MNKSTKILMETVIYLANKVWNIIEEKGLQNEQDVIDFLDELNDISIRG